MKIKQILIITLLFFLFTFSISLVMADITVDSPLELVSNSVEKITLHVNEPLIEMYGNSIYLDCQNCFVASKEGYINDDQLFGGHRSLNIPYSGEKTVSFFIVGSYSDQEAMWNLANLKLTFKLDEDKMKKDYPDMFIPIYGATLSKQFDILDSEHIIILPKIGDFKYEHFGSDRYTNGPPDLSIAEYTFENTNYYERYYTVDVDSEICTGDEKGDQFYLCGNEINQEIIDTGKVDEGRTLKKINWHDGDGYAIVNPYVKKIFEVRDENGKVKFNAALLFLTYKYSILDEKTGTNYFGNLYAEAAVKEGFQDVFFETTAREFEEIINSSSLKKVGSRSRIYDAEYDYQLSDFPLPDDIKEETDSDSCTTNDDCDDKLFCSACGECKKKLIDPSSVNLELKLSNKLSSKSIPNSIRSKALITTSISPTFTHDGKKISYCDIATPGIKKELVATMKNQTPYAGFVILGNFNEERKLEYKTAIDFTKKPLTYSILVMPVDRKKAVGVLGDVTEQIEIKVDDLAITNEKLILTPVDFSIDMKSGGHQLQQGSNKGLKITVNDKETKNIYLKASLIGPGEIQLGEYKSRKAYAHMKQGVSESIMYFSPALGNFDIGEAISSLSMVNLQKEAAKQIAEDVVLAYAGDYFQGAEDAALAANTAEKAGSKAVAGFFKRNPGKYDPMKALGYLKNYAANSANANKLDAIAKAHKLYAGTYGLSQIPGGITGMSGDMTNAASTNTVSSKKTWTESVAEYGVVGIDLAQTGMGILTFIPSKIPVIKHASAGIKSAFSAMTNIWKANFKYIAADEKIARAKEKFIPAMVLITAEDESGWFMTQGYIFQVAYHEI